VNISIIYKVDYWNIYSFSFEFLNLIFIRIGSLHLIFLLQFHFSGEVIRKFSISFIFKFLIISFCWFSTRGVVVNQNGVKVGELLGDGLVLEFSKTDVVGLLVICLRLSNTTSANATFSVIDFGYSDADLQHIHPLGLYSNLKFFLSQSDIFLKDSQQNNLYMLSSIKHNFGVLLCLSRLSILKTTLSLCFPLCELMAMRVLLLHMLITRQRVWCTHLVYCIPYLGFSSSLYL